MGCMDGWFLALGGDSEESSYLHGAADLAGWTKRLLATPPSSMYACSFLTIYPIGSPYMSAQRKEKH